MKKAIIIGLVLVIFPSVSFGLGNIYVDGTGAFTQAKDAENQFGGGASLLYGITPEVNFSVKSIFNTRKIGPEETPAGEKYYDKYEYTMILGGLEYLYNISNIPLYWKSSIGFGAGSVTMETDSIYKVDDDGFCVAFHTGLLYVFTQKLGAFFDLGYHKTFFFNDLEEAKIMGFQFMVGIRFTAWGVNKSIYSDY